ncbi:uncharacterized protein [Acropora muricata]|uniref:uncharacterized protein n=1 Tax=Acropora muricata TaxID=159855 RepID=UPI0034E59973
MSLLSSLFVSSVLLYVVLEASIRDSVTVSEDSKKLSISQVKKTLNKAHLENHGYKKKVTQETSKDSRGRLRYSKITSFIHKRVPCSKASQVVNEAKSMLLKYTENPMTGKELSKMVERLKKEMGSQKTSRRSLCTIEFDLKTTGPSQSGNYRAKRSSGFGGGGSSDENGEESGSESESESKGSFSGSCTVEFSGSWGWR